jgi:site-specific DNA recombinase
MGPRPQTRWCAVYTRKSTEEGLEQQFNSLDAQREAAQAYIKSQQHEGWRALTAHYDDGGFSGARSNVPASSGCSRTSRRPRSRSSWSIRVDRLTRSLADFAKLIELFEAHNVSFVSVTQQFNTTTSMGRLMLNVLLSFAQFEREVTGERIRDKIAASKKKGMWMGGTPPLGYDVKDRKLVVNETEAALVRLIFESYVQLGTVTRLMQAMAEQGHRTKRYTSVSGATYGGVPFSRGHLYRMPTASISARPSTERRATPASTPPSSRRPYGIKSRACWPPTGRRLRQTNESAHRLCSRAGWSTVPATG